MQREGHIWHGDAQTATIPAPAPALGIHSAYVRDLVHVSAADEGLLWRGAKEPCELPIYTDYPNVGGR